MVYIMICACYTWTNNWSALFHIKLHVEHFNINRVSPLLRKPWNQRVLEIKDIFGNSPKKIFSQFTGFGVEFNEFGILDLDYLVLTLLKKGWSPSESLTKRWIKPQRYSLLNLTKIPTSWVLTYFSIYKTCDLQRKIFCREYSFSYVWWKLRKFI